MTGVEMRSKIPMVCSLLAIAFASPLIAQVNSSKLAVRPKLQIINGTDSPVDVFW